MKNKNSVSYEDAGVSVERGNQLVERIKDSAKRTHRDGVMSGLGGFGALFDLTKLNYKQPVLVSGTDGVGTKLKLAIETGRHTTIGIDLVAMCVNDLLVQGAEPLFFLDYYACSKLDVDTASAVVKGIADGCDLSECALVGGETAEMPGIYQTGDYDLAGFCVGIVEKNQIIDGSKISQGDSIIAIASSGPHSNGYSLIRKLIDDTGVDLGLEIETKTLIDHLLEPTKIYTRSILPLLNQYPVNGLAHITGGGLTENIPRVLPDFLHAEIRRNSISMPTIFNWLQEQGNITEQEMLRTFNCGIGMVLIASPGEEANIIETLNRQGEHAWNIGRIIKTQQSEPAVSYL